MMLFARLRRSVALVICPELGARSSADDLTADAEFHRLARQRWIDAERKNLIEEGEKLGYKPSRQDRLLAIRAVIGGGKPFDAGTDGSVSAGQSIADFKNDGDQDRVLDAGLGLKQRNAIFDHVSSPVGVGTSQGKEASGPVKSGSGRKLDDSLAGDLICVAFLFGLIPAILSLGGM